VGPENFFLFGMTVEEVQARLGASPAGRPAYVASPALREVVDLIRDGFFSPEAPTRFRPLMDRLIAHDEYCVFADFDDYAATQQSLAEAYLDRPRWLRMSAINIAKNGRFSSDRTIREYARDIWGIDPVSVE
jgi:starch phosphorylase